MNVYDLLVGEFESVSTVLEHKIKSGRNMGKISHKQDWSKYLRKVYTINHDFLPYLFLPKQSTNTPSTRFHGITYLENNNLTKGSCTRLHGQLWGKYYPAT